MKKIISIYLDHILEAIFKIEEFTKEMDFSDFEKDEKTQDAVMRKLEIIGEAVKNLPSDFKEKYKDIPWKEISGMRDKLIHHYFGVDIFAVWLVVERDLKILKEKIKKIKENIS